MFYKISDDFVININAIDFFELKSQRIGGNPTKRGDLHWSVEVHVRGHVALFTFPYKNLAESLLDELTNMVLNINEGSCPFCKNADQWAVADFGLENGLPHAVVCYNCHAQGPYADSPDEAIKLWGRVINE